MPVSPCKTRQRINRCEIAPMQVFENDDPRSLGAHALDEIAELAKHALARGSEYLALERGPVLDAEKFRHLRQPGRCAIAQRLQ